jgi:hypothetical protein
MVKDKGNREETPVGNPAREKTARNAKAQASLIASAEPPTKASLSMTLPPTPYSHIMSFPFQIATVATRKTARAGSAKKANGRVATPLNDEVSEFTHFLL